MLRRFPTSKPRGGLARLGLLALAGLLLTSLVALQAETQRADAASATIDDTGSQFRWNGAWVTKQDANAIGGTEHVVNGVGARSTLQFSGSSVTIHYTQAPDRAIARVTIDGKAKPALDQFGSLAHRRSVTYQLAPGWHTLVVTNSGSRNRQSQGWWTGVDAVTIDGTGPAPVATPTTTSTPSTAATATATATSTPLPPTATGVPPTATPAPPTATPSGQASPVAGQPCPQWYHDQITTTGPDGKPYPTWHPAVDTATGCYFGHEHGDDPRTSRANAKMPAFGYIGLLAGDNEPHVGFKVFVQNAGARNNDGRTLSHDSRMVFHMGTGGPKRFSTRFHSLEYDFIARDGSGHEVHVMGMADTGGVGSICSNPRQGKTVMFVPGLCKTDSPYEIWEVKLNVGGKAQAIASFAAFDPTTIMDPADPTRVLNMGDLYPQYGHGLGCKREAYSGPVYYYNRSGPATFRTDAYGKLDPNGPIVQYVSLHDDLGVKMTTDGTQTQAKLQSHHCGKPGLKAPN